ncbi:hypothetical protein MHPYR_30161 [uncultured Mycobacterium sp.]|uniref:Uncharacterized protein n=1 Tax=uncultured Mycobacterium sp. TaxID=171292 RepID=A0A1Y5PBT3_9MYCO|nr:hypothetical protein MHPYR_30161 [uncultured Mycobacterium sp.]
MANNKVKLIASLLGRYLPLPGGPAKA